MRKYNEPNDAGGDADKYTDKQFSGACPNRDIQEWREGADFHDEKPSDFTVKQLNSARLYANAVIASLEAALPEHGDKSMYQEIHLCLMFAKTLQSAVSHTLQNAKAD